MKVTVVQGWTTHYPDPLLVSKGVQVRLDKSRASEWPGWCWCGTDNDRWGWIPDAFLERDGENARLIADYSARELTVTEGQLLTVIRAVAGWFWCRTETAETGWVPQRNVLPCTLNEHVD